MGSINGRISIQPTLRGRVGQRGVMRAPIVVTSEIITQMGVRGHVEASVVVSPRFVDAGYQMVIFSMGS